MDPDELMTRARSRAEVLKGQAPGPPAPARVREEAVGFLRTAPEPPLYRRLQDPAREAAVRALPEATELLARVWACKEDASLDPALVQAVELQARALCYATEGQLTQAERAFCARLELERAFRLGILGASPAARPVYDRARGLSRFDPGQETPFQLRLVCPEPRCREPQSSTLLPAARVEPVTCAHCGTRFLAVAGELTRFDVQDTARGKEYVLRLEGAHGGAVRVGFEDTSGEPLAVAPGDWVALVYSARRQLRAVVSLVTQRVVWVYAPGPCFVASAAFGPEAEELKAFRAFRDEVLLPRRAGRWLVRAYYARGPRWAASLSRHPRAREWVRRSLAAVHQRLQRSGFG